LPHDERLPRRERITREHEYKQVIRNGRVISGRGCKVHLLVREGLARKAGFIAGKAAGDACDRSRARRLLKEAYRRLKPRLKADGFRVVFISKANTARYSEAALRQDLTSIFRRQGLLGDDNENN
jgi:ribonuclease P protein component